MTKDELEILLNLLKKEKLLVDNKFNNSKLFNTVSFDYDVDIEIRLNFLYAYLRHLAQAIVEYSPCVNPDPVENYQYKILLSKKMIDICKHVESAYNLDLGTNIKIFEFLISEIKCKYNKIAFNNE